MLQEKGDKDGEEKKPGEGDDGDGENEEIEDEEDEIADDDYAQVHDTSEHIVFLRWIAWPNSSYFPKS